MGKIRLLPYFIIVIIISLTAFFALKLPEVKFDNDQSKWLPANHLTTLSHNKIEDIFGDNDSILVGMEFPDSGLLSVKNLKTISEFTKEIEEMKGVKDAKNLMNYDFIRNVDGDIEVKEIAENVPQDENDLNEMREKLTSWNMYKGHLYSDDFSSTTVTVNLSDNADDDEKKIVYEDVMNLKGKYEGDNVKIYITGNTVITDQLNDYMKSDLAVLLPVVIILLLLILAVSFKRISGVVLPILSVLIITIWTMGLTPILNQKISMISIIIPIILVAIGSAYGIHIMNHYIEGIKNKPGDLITKKEKRNIAIDSLKKIGLPVFLSALTTMAGFSTLAFVGLIPIRDFGILSSIGVFFGFIVTVTFIPSVLYVTARDTRKKKKNVEKKKTILDSLLGGASELILKKPVIILVVTSIITVIAVIGMFRVNVDNSFIEFFKKNSNIRISDDFLNRKLSGSYSLDLLVEGKNPGDLNHPSILKAIEGLGNYLTDKVPNVKKVVSYADLVKKMNESFNSDDGRNKKYYEIPADPEKYGLSTDDDLKSLITQYLMLYSGSTSDYMNDSLEPTAAKVTILLNSPKPEVLDRVEKEIKRYIHDEFPKDFTCSISGSAKVTNDVNQTVIHIKITNIIMSIIIVMLILMFTYLSFTCGLLSIIPITLSVIINFGVMGFLGIKLNMATAMISSITVGTGIDYTIHFISGYKFNIMKYNDSVLATKYTVASSGKAIVYNAISVAFGFAVLLFSNLYPLSDFGFLMCLSMLSSSLLAIFIVPVMFNILTPGFLYKQENAVFTGVKNILKGLIYEK